MTYVPEIYKELGNRTAADFRMRIFPLINYEPMPFQAKVHESNAKYRIVAAAARAGKTWLAIFEIIARMHYPIKQTIWCVGPSYKIAMKVFREIWDFLATPYGLKMFPMDIARQSDMYVKLKNGTIIEGKSTENPTSLLGEGVDLMVIDEASRIPEEIYNRYLLTRLTTSNGDLLAISTPCGLNTGFHKLFLQGKDPEYDYVESWTGTIYDNIILPKVAVERIVKNLKQNDPIAYEQEVLGKFVAHEGAVFPTFDEKIFFGKVEYDPNLPVEASIDHGFRNPFSCLFIQRSGHQIRIIDMYYKAGMGDIDHVDVLEPMFEKLDIRTCVVDPREPNTLATFRKLIPSCSFIPGPAKEIALGIQIIRDHLIVDKESNKPLFLADYNNCKKLLWEFHQAHYKTGELEVPVDKDNHALSCLRYYMLKFCNILNRTELAHFASVIDNERRFFTNDMMDSGTSFDLLSRPWMGGFSE